MKKKKGYKGMAMEGMIAKSYAKNTQKDMAEYKKHAALVAEQLKENDNVLEIAPGPGHSSIELAKLGNFNIIGLDISKTFVEIAKKNAKSEDVSVQFLQGNASDMVFEANSFDFIFCRAAFKNFEDPIGALNEIYRVIKTNGRVLISDLRKDVSSKSIDEYVDSMGMNIVDALATKLTFNTMLKSRAYTKEQFEEYISKSEFKKYKIDITPMELNIWLEK